MKKLRTHYHHGYECTECGMVYMDEPKACLNCGRKHCIRDLNDDPMADDPRGDEVRLSRASAPRIERYRGER